MNYLEAIFLGLVQGLSEFLPISSSGHLVIFQQLFGLSDDIAANMLFDVFVHIGTLVAVFVAFRHRIWRLIKAVGGIVADPVSYTHLDVYKRQLRPRRARHRPVQQF